MTKGFLISFEGIDGSGKTTQLNRLIAHLQGQGYKVALLREPGGTAISERIRELLLDARNQIEPMAEALLYAAARAQLVREVVIPMLNCGTIILADRFIDSTIAYQGYGRGLDISQLSEINRMAAGGLEPELTFLLDIPAPLAAERRQGSVPDRLEKEGLEFQSRIRAGYLALAMELGRFRVIDGTQPVEQITEEIVEVVTQFLKGVGGVEN
ncbi:MAG: dTMP kinase [Syntrophomonadaceae bacterium]|nr:dTMP kinase [Syntrophomonadaceae bacterium]